MNAERRRLDEARERVAHWKRWGPYVSERAWGTVREDYSAKGDVWEYLPHEQARSRAYRWSEDGIAGICDRHQEVCLALALWNGEDAILKERLFGLTGKEGNHGEDVKEYYFYLDSTPTHSFMRMLYKYPQRAFPYEALLEENRRRGRDQPEFELIDTGIFAEQRYFDLFVDYAKVDAEDLLMQITVVNRGPEAAPLHVLPTVWFRNTWTWDGCTDKPSLRAVATPAPAPVPEATPTAASGSTQASDPPSSVTPSSVTPSTGPSQAPSPTCRAIEIDTRRYGRRWLYVEGAPELLFTENETNPRRLFDADNVSPFVKDGINDRVVQGVRNAVNPAGEGTKASAHYVLMVPAGETMTVRVRFSPLGPDRLAAPFDDFDHLLARRRREADDFYAGVIPASLSADAAAVMRQSLGGMLWSKQYYHYIVRDWLAGDPALPPPPSERAAGRNHAWKHLFNADVISMPDKWEYPWYAAWDLAFHCVPLALVDADFAKEQLVLMLREWYMHPNGQLPAYEWALGDVNPPVHAWAAWRVYKIDKKRRGGVGDRAFLERVFQKLLLNFTWWVNRKDAEGSNVFEGGFLGLDNIGVFDRSAPLPTGGLLEQSDGTSWMAMYALNLMAIAMELARENPAYEDVASKFWEHFLYIGHAMGHQDRDEPRDLWDEEDGFFYDCLRLENGARLPLKVRSMVGLVPLFAVETLEPEMLARLPGFTRRLEWFIDHRGDLTDNVACMRTPGRGERRLLSVVSAGRLRRVLRYMLDEREFLSPFGVRALSRFHRDQPYVLPVNGEVHRVDYEPGESSTGLFGGNSNWRGPIWLPMNYLLVESLQKFHHYFGDEFTIECPTGSGRMMTLAQVAEELSHRLSHLFLRDAQGRRPVFGDEATFQQDPQWRDYVPFHEYFHGETGRGLGASHQTGWTGLVAKLLQQSGD